MFNTPDQASGPSPGPLLTEMISGFMLSQALHVAAQLRLADFVAEGIENSDALAQATGTHPGSLLRLLRALAAVGVFRQTAPYRFALTQLGEQLRSGVPESLRNYAMFFGSETMWRTWSDLLHSVRTGEAGFEHVFGMPSFQHMVLHPERARIFDEAMAEMTRQAETAVEHSPYFARFRRIVDVGGGKGTFLAAILRVNPDATGTVFDLPHCAEHAREEIVAAALTDRCTFTGGNFLQFVPPDGDAYLLKNVLHDWDDERCVAILTNCREAMPRDAHVLIVERLMPETVQPCGPHKAVALLDLHMLVSPGGRQRTKAEFQQLLAAAGFSLSGTFALEGTPIDILEGVPL